MHTKGPWKMESLTLDFADYWRISPDYPCYKRISLVYRSGKDGEANARLIAAAPELWQACNDALFTIQNKSYAKSPEVIATLEDILTEALSKAKGE